MNSSLIHGDALTELRKMSDESVHCCVTSPPYWGLRDYGVEGQIGIEKNPAEYLLRLVEVFREVRRVLRRDGTCWINVGDSYANDGKWGGTTGGKHIAALHGAPVGRGKRSTGLKPKNLVGIPWRLAFSLQKDGWCLRQDIVWSKPNPMPESVTDRCTKAHEYVFLLSKSPRYYYDAGAIKERAAKGLAGSRFDTGKTATHQHGRAMFGDRVDSEYRNRRSVWTIASEPSAEAHFATYPTELVRPCILAGCPEGGTVLDPFSGSGTTGVVALRLGRHYIGCELSAEYLEMSRRRIEGDRPLLNVVANE